MRRAGGEASGALRVSFVQSFLVVVGCFVMPEVDISGCGVVGSLVVMRVFLMVDEGLDLGLKIALREAVFQQDAVLEGLVPALDLALGLQMIWRTAGVLNAFVC